MCYTLKELETGVPELLDILCTSTIKRRRRWKQYVFEITDKVLKYRKLKVTTYYDIASAIFCMLVDSKKSREEYSSIKS